MIEVEKKFLLTDEQKGRLFAGAVELGNKKIEDVYFDTEDYKLTANDYWFRLRDGAYELKAPLKSGSGSYATANRYNEITDLQVIAQELKLPETLDFETAFAQAGIKRFMVCFSDRTSYEKQGFRIDVDAATYLDSDFKYSLAEIELLVEDESQADEAEQKIFGFAKEHDLATDKVILGKVAVYLQAEKPAHYQALVAAGIFK